MANEQLADVQPIEITLRAIILAVFLTAILAASNVYLALKLGNTIAASIPAAVLSLSILRFFKRSSILESNLVQTSASAGEGVAAAVSFVLPALIITRFWSHFYYWQTFVLVIIGGMLGVLFSIPLRRLLINHKDLNFPEGTAIGKVLKSTLESKSHFKNLTFGGLFGSIIVLSQSGFKIVAETWPLWWRRDNILFGTSLGFSPAMIAAGFIVGMQACISMLVGLVLGWVIGVPLLSLEYGLPAQGAPYDMAMSLWSHHIRFIGVGTMLLGGAWTFLTIIKPIYYGLKMSFQSIRLSRGTYLAEPRQERDIPMIWVVLGASVLTILTYFCFSYFLTFHEGHLPTGSIILLSCFATFCTVVGGFFLASICCYLSGLIGMTNNPLSGLLLIAVLTLSTLLSLGLLVQSSHFLTNKVAFVILITTIIATITSISGENIQDLKAGQIIGATPWKQQIMIMLGVVIAAGVVGPVLELLFQAYGIGGIFPQMGMDPSQMLSAPQAGLITAVTESVFGHTVPWKDMSIGMVIAAFAILVDSHIKRYNLRLPILAIGLGIYLPPEIVMPVVIGGIMNYVVKQSGKKRVQTNENATLLACGIVAGSALTGVLLAIPFVLLGSSDALKIMSDQWIPYANILGVLVTIILCYTLYHASVGDKN